MIEPSSSACERLYRADSRQLRFDARVTSCRPDGPDRFLVELDRTAFYPTGGGQPFDTGTLDGFPVSDVREAGEGRIEHRIAASRPLEGTVRGEVDAARRFDHMQQHSGQHILSRAFVEVAGAATRSFHLGEATCTIDLELALPETALMMAAQRRANEVIFADEPVEVRLLEQEEAGSLAADMNLMRELAVKPGDPIRLIRIGAFDETPCGGTHVGRAGEVGAVAVRSFERFKGGTRVSFLCGGRVVREMAALGGIVDRLGARLSASPAELEAAVEKLQSQISHLRQETKSLGESLAGHEAAALESGAREAGSCRVIVRLLHGCGAEQLQRIARMAIGAPGRVALLAGVDPATGQVGLVFARSASGVPGDPKMGDLLASVASAHGGKGGGSPTLARGGGVAVDRAEALLEEAWTRLQPRLSS